MPETREFIERIEHEYWRLEREQHRHGGFMERGIRPILVLNVEDFYNVRTYELANTPPNTMVRPRYEEEAGQFYFMGCQIMPTPFLNKGVIQFVKILSNTEDREKKISQRKFLKESSSKRKK